ncbi:MAG: hypothetical protein NXH73_11705 [Flavobacteriaceae bacterium]|nr:hypothetical protein [Flavobacteriaceae bacterium]
MLRNLYNSLNPFQISKLNLDKKVVFVIGTGRSGTHLIGRTIGSSSKVDAHIESTDFFNKFTQLAVNFENVNTQEVFFNLLESYNKFLKKSSKNIILEKTHPLIWFAENIKEKMENAYFIGIKRNCYATVSSMLKHKGVLNWYDQLDQTKPNRFLGITEQNKNSFKNLPIESKCALRWKSHTDELFRLKSVLGDRYLLVDYESFYEPNHTFLDDFNKMINEGLEFKVETLKPDSLEKWKNSLSNQQIENIKNTLF